MDLENLPPLNQLSIEQKDELINELLLLVPLVKALRQKVSDLEQKVADLESRLNQNSRNSHKPPSTDGFKRVKIQHEKGSKRSGGQVGHKGQTLKVCDKPDKIIEYPLIVCPNCRSNIKDTNHIGYKIAQVFDIPQMKIEVTEHRFFEKICPDCGKICSANLPQGLNFGPQYSKQLKAFLVYLHHYQFIPSERICEFFKDVFNHPLGEAAIFKAVEDSFINLQGFEEELKRQIQKEEVLHGDETSLRIDGKNEWLHVASSKRLTSYFVHSKRGKKAMDEMAILPNFTNTLVHDHWKAYFQYECNHALCNGHHVRELEAVFEGTSHDWARKMQTLLREIKFAKEKGQLRPCKMPLFEERYDKIINDGYIQALALYETGPPIKRKSHPKEVCLLDRLKNKKKQTLMFMYEQDVPFDNNQAERDIRMMKVKMKISGCFRAKTYAQIFCRIRSYISTCKKTGRSVFSALIKAFNGQALCYLPS